MVQSGVQYTEGALSPHGGTRFCLYFTVGHVPALPGTPQRGGCRMWLGLVAHLVQLSRYGNAQRGGDGHSLNVACAIAAVVGAPSYTRQHLRTAMVFLDAAGSNPTTRL